MHRPRLGRSVPHPGTPRWWLLIFSGSGPTATSCCFLFAGSKGAYTNSIIVPSLLQLLPLVASIVPQWLKTRTFSRTLAGRASSHATRSDAWRRRPPPEAFEGERVLSAKRRQQTRDKPSGLHGCARAPRELCAAAHTHTYTHTHTHMCRESCVLPRSTPCLSACTLLIVPWPRL